MSSSPYKGRPATHTDETILDAIESGAMTPNTLLAALSLKSKSTLMIRLRRMQAKGLVSIEGTTRKAGYRITSERWDH